jgi:nickel-dependent lactate racemase
VSLLARVRAATPGVAWETALPARVAPAEAPSVALTRIARRLAIELDGASRTVVVLNDESRETNPDLVATVVRAARGASKAVSILFARGSHALLPRETLDACSDAAFARLGPEEKGGLTIAHHDARAPGVPFQGVELDRLVVEADKVLALGSVEPHYFAGWTGAHKTATIGVMGLAGIEANHAHALEPGSRTLALEGNPVFDGIARVAEALGDRLVCVNETKVEGRLLAWGVGKWRPALEAVLPAARLAFVRDVSGPVDLLVASVEGALARSLYQAEKGIKNSEDCVAAGGSVVLHARCGDGIGPSRFLELLAAARSHAGVLEHVRANGYRLGDHKAVKLRALEARGVAIHLACPELASSPDAARVRGAGLALHGSLEAALEAAIEREPRRALLVEDAGNLVARLST